MENGTNHTNVIYCMNGDDDGKKKNDFISKTRIEEMSENEEKL